MYSRISPANSPSCISQNWIICQFLTHSLAQEWDYQDWVKDEVGIYSRVDYPNKIKPLLKRGKKRKMIEGGTFNVRLYCSKERDSPPLEFLDHWMVPKWRVAQNRKLAILFTYISQICSPMPLPQINHLSSHPIMISTIVPNSHLLLVLHFSQSIFHIVERGWAFSHALSGCSH